jgi:hypothetical protein
MKTKSRSGMTSWTLPVGIKIGEGSNAVLPKQKPIEKMRAVSPPVTEKKELNAYGEPKQKRNSSDRGTLRNQTYHLRMEAVEKLKFIALKKKTTASTIVNQLIEDYVAANAEL